jgi:hypothetical protein
MIEDCKWHMVLPYEKKIAFTFFTICFTLVFFPNLLILSPNNELFNFENKGLKNDGSKG